MDIKALLELATNTCNEAPILMCKRFYFGKKGFKIKFMLSKQHVSIKSIKVIRKVQNTNPFLTKKITKIPKTCVHFENSSPEFIVCEQGTQTNSEDEITSTNEDAQSSCTEITGTTLNNEMPLTRSWYTQTKKEPKKLSASIQTETDSRDFYTQTRTKRYDTRATQYRNTSVCHATQTSKKRYYSTKDTQTTLNSFERGMQTEKFPEQDSRATQTFIETATASFQANSIVLCPIATQTNFLESNEEFMSDDEEPNHLSLMFQSIGQMVNRNTRYSYRELMTEVNEMHCDMYSTQLQLLTDTVSQGIAFKRMELNMKRRFNFHFQKSIPKFKPSCVKPPPEHEAIEMVELSPSPASSPQTIVATKKPRKFFRFTKLFWCK